MRTYATIGRLFACWTRARAISIIAGQGDPGRAEAMAQQTLAICEQRGDRWTTGWVFYVLALTAFAHGDFAAAVTRARDGLRRMLVFHKWPTTSASCPPDRYRRGRPAGTRWSPVDTESARTARRPRGSASAPWRLTMVGGAVRALPLPPTTGRLASPCSRPPPAADRQGRRRTTERVLSRRGPRRQESAAAVTDPS